MRRETELRAWLQRPSVEVEQKGERAEQRESDAGRWWARRGAPAVVGLGAAGRAVASALATANRGERDGADGRRGLGIGGFCSGELAASSAVLLVAGAQQRRLGAPAGGDAATATAVAGLRPAAGAQGRLES